jgi:hypothetical protein
MLVITSINRRVAVNHISDSTDISNFKLDRRVERTA